MRYMTESTHHEQIVPLTEEASRPETGVISIRRSGGKPMIFRGTELGMAMSFVASVPYWYEVNLYQGDPGFVLAIRLYHQDQGKRDTCRTWVFPTIDAAFDHLEAYDAGEDVEVPHDMFRPDMPAAELAAMALDLRARITSARTHFAGLVGEFLYDLDGE